MSVPPYEMIDHTADLGMRVRADNPKGIFDEACRALIEIAGAQTGQGDEIYAVQVQGFDLEDLLIRWLQEVLYLIMVKYVRIKGFTITTYTEDGLEAQIQGKMGTLPPPCPIKAVTYHAVAINRVNDHYETTIIFDT